MKEIEKYKTIYNNPDQWPKYGRFNHGKRALEQYDWQLVYKLVDVGCGHNNFKKAFLEKFPDRSAVGVDFACPSADVIAYAHELPFEDKEFDMLTSFDMLEHVPEEDVDKTLKEFERVSKAFFFSICYRASKNKVNGEGLHPTVKPKEWWLEKLSEAKISIDDGTYIHGVW